MLGRIQIQAQESLTKKKKFLVGGFLFLLVVLLLDFTFSKSTSIEEWAMAKFIGVGYTTTNKCFWTTSYSFFGVKRELCLRDDHDLISSFVRFFGRWYDCDATEKAVVERNAKTYLDIGANIGMCVAAVAPHNNIKVTAVEANPDNVFYLSQTASKFKDIKIHDFGLGFKEDALPIYMDEGNSGSSRFSSEGHIKVGEKAVKIHRVDDMFRDQSFDVVQIDTEGFECKIVCGAIETVRSGKWKYLQTEMENHGLKEQGCSEDLYMEILTGLGFEKVGQGCNFPTLSLFIHIIQDYYLEWRGTTDAKVNKVKEICKRFA